MVHAVSAFYERSGHMSPVAAALAAGLHVATALALFLVSPLNRHDVDPDNDKAIEVTIEQPKPPETPPAQPQPSPPAVQPPAAQPAPSPPPPPTATAKPDPAPQPKPREQPRSKIPIGISPPAPVTPEPPTQKETEKPTTREAVEPPKAAEAKPEPPQPPKPAEPQQQALATPAPEPALEKVLPPVEAPPAPLTMRDFVKVVPPPPAPPTPRPPEHQQPPPQQHQEPPAQTLQHSPLSPSQRPPPQRSANASVSTFVNPAAIAERNRAFDAYRLQVATRISQRQVFAAYNSEEGTVELAMSVARDGRLVDVRVSRSSGSSRLDEASLAAARAASPYGPPPAEIAGNPVSFTLPMGYRRTRQ